MNVLTDFHHASLLNSLILLFENRLNAKLYRPIGEGWHTAGYWKVFDHPATVQQYLGIGGATPDGSEPLNDVVKMEQPDVYLCNDIDSQMTNRGILLQGFMDRDFKYVIATIPEHIEPFRKLCDLHKSKPKLLFQVGNAWTISGDLSKMVDGIMASASLNLLTTKPLIEYHQEFDLTTFNYDDLPENNYKKITSFVNCFNIQENFKSDWQLFEKLEKMMQEYTFKSYGGQCRDGAKHGSIEVAIGMRESQFVWHTKHGGDGYGHIIHNAFAMGRPPIIKKEYYVGKLAEPLIVDEQTAICIDGLNPEQIMNKIQHFTDPKRWNQMSEKAHKTFKKHVNFDYEEQKIRSFLEQVG